jgi:hypothetical protein
MPSKCPLHMTQYFTNKIKCCKTSICLLSFNRSVWLYTEGGSNSKYLKIWKFTHVHWLYVGCDCTHSLSFLWELKCALKSNQLDLLVIKYICKVYLFLYVKKW